MLINYVNLSTSFELLKARLLCLQIIFLFFSFKFISFSFASLKDCFLLLIM